MREPFKRLLNQTALFCGAAAAGLTGFIGNAHAAQPEPWQLGFQPAATDVMDDISWFNDFTLVIATLVTLLVLGLLAICAVRFNRNANPEPSKTTHNTMIEVVWTIAPILILVIIAVPSFRLLYKELDIPEYDMTIKAVGYQWYWGYEYVDEGMEDLTIDSIMLDDEGRKERMAADSLTEQQVPRLLAADYNLVVPVDKTIRVQVTAADVIHAFAMPAFGVKIDAVPGRLNETWFKARETGMYYGQCSELCGKDHAFMPIALQVVTNEQFEKWSEAAKSDVDEANKLLAGLIKEEKLAKKRASEEVTVAER